MGIPFGPYVLQRRLARGGMAEIFLARREGPAGFSRDLVVKRILPHLSEDAHFQEMFVDEARIVARLHHPNVVQVHDFGEVDGSFYLAMELIRGVDLRALVGRAREDAAMRQRSTAVPPHHAAKILSFVCEGLASAHSLTDEQGAPLGLVHRDITPANVLVSFDGAVKIADFGVAKLSREGTRRDDTLIGAVKGKYAYLSPEQARGRPLDGRSDLFNVGILLFEMLSGDTLFPHDALRDAKLMSAAGRIPHPERIDLLDPTLAQIIKRALASKASERYQDALTLRQDLESFLRTCPDASDTVEIGSYVTDLFPDVLIADRQGPRAAGTVPMTQADLDAPALPSSGPSTHVETHAPVGARDASRQRRLSTMATSAPPRRRRRWLWASALLILLIGAGGGGAWWWSQQPAPPDDAPRPPVVRVQRQAELRVVSEPAGVSVAIDGEVAGVAPFRRFLDPGSHRVELRRRDRVVASETVDITAGQMRELTLVAADEPRARLRVVSIPENATVWLGDDPVGHTPVELEVEPGEIRVRVSAPGFVEQTSTVTVREPGETASLSVQLREQPVVAQAADPAPTTMRPNMRRRPPSRGTGTLTINTTPWSEVFLRGRRLGTTPLSNVTLSAGTHTLTLRSPNKPDRRQRVVIREGETTRTRVVL